jgi:hypothetical protein
VPEETKRAAEEYAKKLGEVKKLNEEIKEQEELIDKYKKQGLRDDPKADNKLTRSIEKYADLLEK